jgi:hypothetical protein
MVSNTIFSVSAIAASVLGLAVAGVLPASAQQTAPSAAQQRYLAYAACRREADNAVPLANMISEQATMNHYLALGDCLRKRGYDIALTDGGNASPPR